MEMDKNKKINKLKTVATSVGTSAAVVLLLGGIFAFGAGEPMLQVGANSSGQFGVGTTSPGSNLSVAGTANVGSLVVEGLLKASNIFATGSVAFAGDVLVSDSTKGLRLKDSDGSGCHKISVNSSGTISASNVNCSTGDVLSTAQEGFESYATGGLSGKNETGTGWSGAWTTGAFNDSQVVASGCNEGSKCAKDNQQDSNMYRSMSASLTSGVISFDMKCSGTDNENYDLNSGSTDAWTVKCDGSANIALVGGSTVTIVSSQNNGWYTVEVDFDVAGSGSAIARAKPAGGSFGSWTSAVTEKSAVSNINRLQFRYAHSSGRYMYLDAVNVLSD